VKYPEFLFNFIAMEFLEPEAEHTVSEEKMVTAAKDLVEMNLENYPSSSNAHFNLEMYHLHVNENEEAIGMFEMALEIDTEHQMAKNYLAKANKANN
jgi:Tfp pilus assembly protein PilF